MHGTAVPLQGSAGAAMDRLLAGCVLLLAAGLCLPALRVLSFLWQDSRYYGHGYAIPLAAGLLAWGQRQRIQQALRDLRPPAHGYAVAFCAATCQVLALMGDIRVVAELGIPVLLGAAAYAVGGPALLRPLLAPLSFLTLMVPPPGFFQYRLLLELKVFVTRAAVALLQAAGQPVLAEGNTLHVPGQSLFVADACSGLTSIVTMLPLACIVACFLCRGFWRRALVIASVVPLALFANVLRVVLTVLLVPVLGAEAAQGALHEGFGVATYVGGTLAMVGVARVLR